MQFQYRFLLVAYGSMNYSVPGEAQLRMQKCCAAESGDKAELKPPSLSVFFPAYNDAECLPSLLGNTFSVLPLLTSDYEVVVVNDGSVDATAEVLTKLVAQYAPHLRCVTHEVNRGYGAALRSGFAACTKELVFYTDGDGQYDVRELQNLWDKLGPGVDLVNGYKLNRADSLLRKVIGAVYNRAIRLVFQLKVRDVDCDFRLIRRSLLDRIQLYSDSGSICVELVQKVQNRSRKIEEVGVHHYPRLHGKSQFFRLSSIFFTLCQLFHLCTNRESEVRRLVISQPLR